MVQFPIMIGVSWLLILVALLMWFHRERKKKFSLLKNLGIPGPQPSILSGNLSEILEKGITVVADTWIKKYGDIVGFYNGISPFIMVNDIELVKKVLVDDADKFPGRGDVVAAIAFHPILGQNIGCFKGDRWKNIRSIMTPSFTPSSIKKSFGVMSQCIDDLLSKLQIHAETGTTVNMGHSLEWFTVDVIVRCVLGIETDPTKGGTQSEQALVSDVLNHRTAIIVGRYRLLLNCFAEFPRFWKAVAALRAAIFNTPTNDLVGFLKAIVDIRRSKHKEEGRSALQLMLNVEVPDRVSIIKAILTNSTDTRHSQDKRMSPSKGSPSLTSEEILANSIALLIAGYETTCNSLSFTAYLLAQHTDIQEKIRSEVSSVLREHGELTYESICSMQYVEQFVCEALRMYPPLVGFTTRKAEHDYKYQGIVIPKDAHVLIPTFTLQRNPKFWTDPDKFDPERFSPENKGSICPMAYQPFGHGPRKCVGARFAQHEMKLAVAKLVTQYRLSLDETRHKGDPNVSSWFVMSYPKDGVWLKLQKV